MILAIRAGPCSELRPGLSIVIEKGFCLFLIANREELELCLEIPAGRYA